MVPSKKAAVKKSVFQQADGPMIKADKGFEVLIPVARPDGQVEVERHPVVAWRISRRRLAEPILISTAQEALPYAIKYPSGQICSPQGGCWGSQDEWLASIASESPTRMRLSRG